MFSVVVSNPSLKSRFHCSISEEDSLKLDVFSQDVVYIKGKKKSDTVLSVVVDGQVKSGAVHLHPSAILNLYSHVGDSLFIEPCHDIKIGKSITIQPSNGVDHATCKEFFRGALQQPVCRGNFMILDKEGNLSIKIIDCDPVPYCIVTPETELRITAPMPHDIKIEIDRVKNTEGYDNIGGCSRQLELIKEMIDLPLRHPELFQSIGVTQPRGVLLYGPPGTGKTLIAKAVANETGAFFFTINGPEVMSKMAGESEANLRKIFKEAETNAPSIIFIDEIDSMAPRRDKTSGEVDKRIVSQLLTLMDGIKARSGVMVVAATNRPNSLDPALRRYGRFDREINIGVPDFEGRMEILKIHTRKLKMAKLDLKDIALRTQGFVGADLAQVCTEAAMICIRKSRNRSTRNPKPPSMKTSSGGWRSRSRISNEPCSMPNRRR